MDRFRTFLETRMVERGISARHLSLASGRDESYYQHVLYPPEGRSRAVPTPDDLRLVAPILDVPLGELLEIVWDIAPDDVSRDLTATRPRLGIGVHNQDGIFGGRWEELTAREREEILDYLDYLKWKRERH
jgi:hypothetical protein